METLKPKMARITDRRVFYNFDRFLNFYKPNKNNIEKIRVRPAKLGRSSYGSIEVKLKNPYLNG